MSSSGLIYAVIVGAWAAYLVPMWLRRQDELNEARPTERFSTAIRLLSGRAALERRYAKALDTSDDAQDAPRNTADHAQDPPAPFVDVRALAEPVTTATQVPPSAPAPASAPGHGHGSGHHPAPAPASARARQQAAPPRAGSRRARVLARRRRTILVLFAAFTAGTVAAAVVGLKLLWLPAVPGVALTAYIAHLRLQERRRFEVQLDQRRAAEAAHRLREQRTPRPSPPPTPEPPAPRESHGPYDRTADRHRAPDPRDHTARGRTGSPSAAAPEADRAARRAVVEETDHAEWVDGLRRRAAGQEPDQDGWEPVPVPLPTYVTAPVAPRSTSGVDLTAPDTWSSARSAAPPPPADRPRDRAGTPLFDQYADEDRPRAANE